LATGSQATLKDIKRETCRVFEVTEEELVSMRRVPRIMRARMAAAYLCHGFTSRSLPMIGSCLGYADHSSILNAVQSISKRRLTDDLLNLRLDEVARTLNLKPAKRKKL
jgi:chromosomal replication initiation ATPase DnaA